MSANRRIIETLAPLGLPIEPDVYTGKSAVYLVFNYNALATLFGDDRPWVERHLIQVHLFAPHAFNTIESDLHS